MVSESYRLGYHTATAFLVDRKYAVAGSNA